MKLLAKVLAILPSSVLLLALKSRSDVVSVTMITADDLANMDAVWHDLA